MNEQRFQLLLAKVNYLQSTALCIGSVTDKTRQEDLDVMVKFTQDAADTLLMVENILDKEDGGAHKAAVSEVVVGGVQTRYPDVPGEILNEKVTQLDLNTRIQNCFMAERIITIADLLNHTASELLNIPNFGYKALRDVVDELKKHDIDFIACKR